LSIGKFETPAGLRGVCGGLFSGFGVFWVYQEKSGRLRISVPRAAEMVRTVQAVRVSREAVGLGERRYIGLERRVGGVGQRGEEAGAQLAEAEELYA
jgi:hypothetical protein